MSSTWTTEQILALAPDDASAKAGKGLAGPRKWASLGRDDHALWGECQGSGSNPYQVQIYLAEPAFRCTCPSRKFPCKHGLGLFLMFVGDANAIPEAPPPAWVTEWVAKREEKTHKQAAPKPMKTEEQSAKEAKDQARRAAERQKRVTQGLQDLDLWLRDLVRQGLAAVQTRPYRFWDEAAARLVDAQAPGIARTLREMAGIPNSGPGWQERLLERIGLLTLLMEGFSRIETLPETVQTDIRTEIGWTARQEEILTGDDVTDFWLTIGQRSYDEEQFKVQRTWLWGRNIGRSALILNFTRAGQPLETTLPPGVCFEADLAFFPSAYPLRALLKARKTAAMPLTDIPGYPSLEAMLSEWADALALNPWIETFPAPLANVIPLRRGADWALRDAEGCLLPLSGQFTQGWRLLAISAGRPITLVGEWNGLALLPLSAWAEGRFIRF